MKKIFLPIITFFLLSHLLFSASYHIVTTGSFTYSPDSLAVNVGDTVTIDASTLHPLVQVSKASWESLDPTPLAGGWGSKTSPYTFVPASSDTIYFVCANHVGLGMRGKLIVKSATGIDELTGFSFDFSVAPNPVKSECLVTLPANLNIGFTTMACDEFGNIHELPPPNVIYNEGKCQLLLDASGLNNGLYLLIVSDGRLRFTTKFVVLK